MSDISLFIGGLVNHLTAFITGGFVTAGFTLVERFWRKPLPLWAYAAIFVFGGFVAASYYTWQDEHTLEIQRNRENGNLAEANKNLQASITDLKGQITQLQAEAKPNLIGAIVGFSSGYSPELSAEQIFVLLVITNRGAASIAKNFILHMQSARISIDAPMTHIANGYKLIGKSGNVLAIFHNDQMLEYKASKPIAKYDEVSGFARFVLKGVKPDDVEHGARFTITFEDALGQSTSAAYMTGLNPHTLPYYSGLGVEPFSSKMLKEFKKPH